jgi:hypothetical protein
MFTLVALCVCQRVAAEMDVEREFFDALVALRRDGYRCPSGKVYEPSADMAFDCRLWRAAMSFSKAMAEENFFAHFTPDGQGPCEYARPSAFRPVTKTSRAGSAMRRAC